MKEIEAIRDRYNHNETMKRIGKVTYNLEELGDHHGIEELQDIIDAHAAGTPTGKIVSNIDVRDILMDAFLLGVEHGIARERRERKSDVSKEV